MVVLALRSASVQHVASNHAYAPSAARSPLLPRSRTGRQPFLSPLSNQNRHVRSFAARAAHPSAPHRRQRGAVAAAATQDVSPTEQAPKSGVDAGGKKRVLVLGGTGRVGSSTAASLMQVRQPSPRLACQTPPDHWHGINACCDACTSESESCIGETDLFDSCCQYNALSQAAHQQGDHGVSAL